MWRGAVVLVIAVALALGIAPAGATVCARPHLPAHARLYVIGDSWSAGFHADPARTLNQVAAELLGWRVQVNAQNGTGYLAKGGAGKATYPVRAGAIPASARADVVLIQGGSNDVSQHLDALPTAVDQTIARVESAFPNAWVVLLGPGPDPYPVSAAEHSIDRVLRRTARQSQVTYISMLGEGWITASNLERVIGSATEHPTVAGDAYLGQRLAADLRVLQRHRTSICASSTTTRT